MDEAEVRDRLEALLAEGTRVLTDEGTLELSEGARAAGRWARRCMVES
jgi:hypothetical protein